MFLLKTFVLTLQLPRTNDGVDLAVPEHGDLLVRQGAFRAVRVVAQIISIISVGLYNALCVGNEGVV